MFKVLITYLLLKINIQHIMFLKIAHLSFPQTSDILQPKCR